MVDGQPLSVEGHQTAQDAVLDHLHRHAAALGGTVEARVVDNAAQVVLELSVAPDGSSRIISARPSPAPDRSSRPPVRQAAAGEARPAPLPRRPVQRRRAPERRGTADAPLPEVLAPQIGEINRLIEAGLLHEAREKCSALREQLTSEEGDSHPHALEARSLEAYASYLTGDHQSAIMLALGVARVRCSQQDPKAADEVARAVAIWQQLPDSQAIAVRGMELQNMWTRLAETGALSSEHARLAAYVDQRLRSLRERSYALGGALSPFTG
ncbi:hypothetical protein GCM10010499_28870 [Streptomyces thermoviolaceus subsp. apingens]|nr:hypothetical protein GCM10010499_28870 [Streptomyces thermoviolaceus subsp. apingens]